MSSFLKTSSSSADVDLHTRVGIALSLHSRKSLRHLRFFVAEGNVRIEGAVPSYFERQIAIALIRRIAGVYGVDDRLTVEENANRDENADKFWRVDDRLPVEANAGSAEGSAISESRRGVISTEIQPSVLTSIVAATP